ncbi:MAG: glycoside hydrolase family 10 protein [bacterium]
MKIKFLFIIIFILFIKTFTFVEQSSSGEIRGLWVVRDVITDSSKIIMLAKDAKMFGFTDLFVQVRGAGDAYYLSNGEPRPFALENLPEGVDPLQMAICLLHQKGLKVHAWLNVIYSAPGQGYKMKDEHILAKYPSWCEEDIFSRSLMDYTREMLIKTDCEGLYLKPEYLQISKYLSNTTVEIINKYKIDGLHLDFIRYPNIRFGYSNYACAEFKSKYGIDPRIFPQYPPVSDPLSSPAHLWLYIHQLEWFYYRAEKITDVVKTIRNTLKDREPDILLSAAVWFPSKLAYRYVGQDWIRWLSDDLIDLACPMAYSSKPTDIEKDLTPLIQKGYHIALGIGAWRDSVDDIRSYIDLTRAIGTDGFILFSYGDILNEKILLISLKLKEDDMNNVGFKHKLSSETLDCPYNNENIDIKDKSSIKKIIEIGRKSGEEKIDMEIWKDVLYSENRSSNNPFLYSINDYMVNDILKGVNAIDELVNSILLEKYHLLKIDTGNNKEISIKNMRKWQDEVIAEVDKLLEEVK